MKGVDKKWPVFVIGSENITVSAFLMVRETGQFKPSVAESTDDKEPYVVSNMRIFDNCGCEIRNFVSSETESSISGAHAVMFIKEMVETVHISSY